jgi:hypothetical protein
MKSRVATDLELKHFKELIAPITALMGQNGDEEPEMTLALSRLVRKVIEELDRFGYMPNSICLLVRVDPSCIDVTLTDEEDETVMGSLSDLYDKLGVRTV